ncbi:MAG TPA: histidine kinase [Microlunatus sp.]|nr:histidine kinase [Microlunatus sp.]
MPAPISHSRGSLAEPVPFLRAGIVEGAVESSLRSAAERIRTAERRRIQQQLHDGLQQELVALVASLGSARSALGRWPEPVGELVDEAYRTAQRIVADLRDLLQGIYPSVLPDLGLVPAIEANARRVPVPDGAGLPPAVVAAGGPVSLRDRVEAVGGTVRSAVTPGGGTIVRARLPAHGCPGMAGRFFDGGAGR